jgi:acid phosphatase family membrane protein YuiD
MNKAFTTAIAAMGAAQLIKMQLKRRETGVTDWLTLTQTGGMPSSHSAAVTSLATYVGFKKGWKSVPFALSSIFGMIVMYDAMGIRRHAGEIAMEVNQLEEEVEKLSNEHFPGDYHRKREKDLKELLGHMPAEVAGGALLGIGAGAVGYWLFH